jgi:hypothetical protein
MQIKIENTQSTATSGKPFPSRPHMTHPLA